MPKSVTNYKALQLNNCIGPTTIGALSVTGTDVPYGAKIKVQAFGGFGMTRTVNASNKNITGLTRRIRNRKLIETSNNTDGYYVPWLRDRVDGQIAAGKKMIFSRKFDEGNHIFEFQMRLNLSEDHIFIFWKKPRTNKIMLHHCYPTTLNI